MFHTDDPLRLRFIPRTPRLDRAGAGLAGPGARRWFAVRCATPRFHIVASCSFYVARYALIFAKLELEGICALGFAPP
jgi:hypothetical protein